MMKFLSLSTLSAICVVSFSSSAASLTVKWTGVVPSLNCTTGQISNQVDFKILNARCGQALKYDVQRPEADRPVGIAANASNASEVVVKTPRHVVTFDL